MLFRLSFNREKPEICEKKWAKNTAIIGHTLLAYESGMCPEQSIVNKTSYKGLIIHAIAAT